MFVAVADTRRNRPKTFVIVETAFFEMFVSIDLLGPKKMFSSIAESLLKRPVDSYKLFPDICHVR